MIGRFRNGALASSEAMRFAPGRENSITLEINGSGGSLFFDLEEMNRLRFYSMRDAQDRHGFRDIIVTERTHPYIDKWWPPGHIIGYEHTFTHSRRFRESGRGSKKRAPNFRRRAQKSVRLDATSQSARTKNWVDL